MKNLIIIVLLLASSSLSGQFTFGPKVGYSASKLTTDFDEIKESVKHNFQIGAFARIGKKLYFQPEVYYTTSGGTLEMDGDDFKEEIKLKSISFPMLLGFKVVNLKVFNLHLMAGPTANFILNKNIDSGDYIPNPIQGSHLKDVAWGLDFGAGIDVFFLTLDIRYELGLNNIYLPPTGASIQKMKSNLFIVSLGFKLL